MDIHLAYDPEAHAYRAVHDLSRDRSIVTTLVVALEEIRDDGVEPGRLYDVVDPDALDDIFRPRSDIAPPRQGHVTFPFEGYGVTVRSDGTIFLEPLERDASPVGGDDRA